MIFLVLLYLAILALIIIGAWKMFEKAGKPGWAALIPIYNIIVLLEIVGRPLWWIVLCLIPCVNIVIIFLVMLDLAKSFGKDVAYGVGLFFLSAIFVPILGFGQAKYVGPAAATKAVPPPAPSA